MRTIVTAIFIFAFLALVLVGENVFSTGFCNDFSKEISDVYDEIQNNNSQTVQKVEHLAKMWEKEKNNVFVFADHKNFQEIESSLYSALHCVKNNKKAEALFHIDALYHRVKEFEEGIRLTSGNLF